jgi:cytochrome b561-like protein
VTRLTARIDAIVVPRLDAVQTALQSPTRNPRGAVVVGRLLGADVLAVLLTGLWSHVVQDPPEWLTLPTRPASLYQWTQGAHVVLGTALLPLVLAKLWVVYPRLFTWPPVTSVANGLERASVAVLVATSLLQPVTGLLNTYQWYPWPFPFRETHYALAWVMAGAVLVHLGVKLPVIRQHWRDGGES